MDLIKSEILPIHGVAVSMQGGRPENQDDLGFMDTPVGFLLVVCDGMGGGPGGKTASYIAKCEVAAALCECNPQTPREHALKMAVSRAHEALEQKMKETPALSGMGSTIVAVLINRESAIVAHAGDSRCYRLHGKKCLYRSLDHSLVAELVKKKAMTEEEARLSPQSNVISRGLGSVSNHVPEIEEIPYKKGDRFVLCTDGVWGCMPQKNLLTRLTAVSDLQNLVSNLSTEIDKIGFSTGGGHDNHTMAIIEMGADSLIKDPRDWQKIALWGTAIGVAMAVLTCILVLVIQDHKEKEIASENNISYPSMPRPPRGGNGQDFTGTVSTSTTKEAGKDKGTEEKETSKDTDKEKATKSEEVKNAKETPKPEGGKIGFVISDSIRERVKNMIEGRSTKPDTAQQEREETKKAETKPQSKQQTTTTPKSQSETERIYAAIDSLMHTRKATSKDAVAAQNAHIRFIQTKLKEIRKSDEARKDKADKTLGQMKTYSHLNNVMEDSKQPNTFIPTSKAIEEIKDLKRRIDWINK